MLSKGTFLFSVMVILGLFFRCSPPVGENRPSARKGLIDLSCWRLDEGRPLELSGEWEFFRDQFFDSPDGKVPASGKEYIQLPGLWNGYEVDGKKMEGRGFATFRLRVRLGAWGEDWLYAMKIPIIQTAFSLWIDRTKRISVGEVGRNEEESRPAYGPSLLIFKPPAREFEILLQVSNFHYGEGGIPDSIMFGRAGEMKAHWDRNIGFAFFLLGSIFIMGVYHFGLFINRKKDRASLGFSLFCFFIIPASFFMGDHLFYLFFPGFSWEWSIKISYIVNNCNAVIFLVYLRAFFPGEFSKKIGIGFYTVLTALSVMVLFSPAAFFTVLRNVFYIVLCFICLDIIYRIALAFIRKREGAVWFSFCTIILIGTVIYEIASDFTMGKTWALIPFGLFIFLSGQSFILAARVTKTFISNKVVAENLKKTNASLLRLDRLKEAFLSKTSGDLQIPVNDIFTRTEKITGDPYEVLSASTRENLDLIYLSAGMLSRLVCDIRDYSALKKGVLHPAKKPVDMYRLTSSVLRMMKVLVEGKDVEFINALPADGCYVLGDEGRLHRIMFNLIQNAVKFTSWGYVMVCMKEVEGGIHIRVQDTGIGISSEKQGIVFSSFEQNHKIGSGLSGGIGLGLGVTKQLVELMGGTLNLKSVKGEGACFSFTLPAASGYKNPFRGGNDAASIISSEPKASFPVQKKVPGAEEDDFHFSLYSGKRILVVDDNPVNIKVVTNILTLEGVEYLTASSGNAAVKILKEDRDFHLVILDIMMTGIDGFETCRLIREELEFRMEQLPVILVTAKTGMEALAEGFKAGANDFITKPFTREELWARLRFHLNFSDITCELENLTSKLEVELDEDTRLLEARNHEMLDGIQYSRNILSAAMPQGECFSRYVRESFVYLKPRAMVGGDFYWVFEPASSGGFFVSVIDCPGIDVPGALAALLVNSLLHRICQNFGADNPSEILFFLNWQMKCRLAYETLEHIFQDGLSISICYVNPGEKRLVFAGAGHSLFIEKGGKVFEILGKRQSLGRKDAEFDMEYPNNTVPIEGNETFYLLSNGFLVQNGGRSDFPLGKPRFKKWLAEAAGKSMDEQKEFLLEKFGEYKGGEKQRDDILLMGFRV